MSQRPSVTDKQATRRLVQAAISTHRSWFGSDFFRQVANLGRQAADALHHAHEHGIVHRDIKPGNLMIGANGKIWVTDFGLAKIETDAGMTMTGDLLGTLRYMAPEQALAKRIVVDHRADIYSLGVTLYELLTLRPVFDGDDREELLKQLAFEEAKPIRHFQPDTPDELETIVLKAISKNPDERYATAAEFAEDLQAFMQHRPIKAKRADENFRHARDAVNQYFTTVSEDELLNQPGTQPLRKKLLNLALEYYQQFIKEQAEDPDRQLDLATAYNRAGRIAQTLGDRDTQHESYAKALEIMQTLAIEQPDDERVQASLARSLLNTSQFMPSLDESLVHVEQAIEIATRLKTPDHRFVLAEAYGALTRIKGIQFRSRGDTESARDELLALQNEEKVLQELIEYDPENSVHQARLANVFIGFYSHHDLMGNDTEADEYLQKSLQIADRLAKRYPDDWRRQDVRSAMYSQAGDHEMALEVFRKVVTENPSVPSCQSHLAHLYGNAAYGQEEQGRIDESLASRRAAVDIRRKLAEQYPENDLENEFAVDYDLLGQAQRRSGKLDEAIASFGQAISILQLLQQCFIDGRTGQANPLHLPEADYSLRYLRRGVVRCLNDLGRNDDARAFLQEQLSIWERLRTESSHPNECAHQLLSIHLQLAAAWQQSGNVDEAQIQYDRVVEILNGWAGDQPSYLTAVSLSLEDFDAMERSGSERNDLASGYLQIVEAALPTARDALRAVVGGEDESEWDDWNRISLAHYRNQNWVGAEADAELAVQWAFDNPSDSAGMVPLFLFAGREERYHEVCQQFLDHWTEWTDDDLLCVAGLCTLDRVPPEDLVSLKGLIERTISAYPERRAELLSRVAIRLGKYQQAIDYLLSDPSTDRDPICQVTLTIAHHHANHPDEARAALEKVPRAFAEVNLERFIDYQENPNRRMEFRALRHEAEGLLFGGR